MSYEGVTCSFPPGGGAGGKIFITMTYEEETNKAYFNCSLKAVLALVLFGSSSSTFW
jgi:hypothetical protein